MNASRRTAKHFFRQYFLLVAVFRCAFFGALSQAAELLELPPLRSVTPPSAERTPPLPLPPTPAKVRSVEAASLSCEEVKKKYLGAHQRLVKKPEEIQRDLCKRSALSPVNQEVSNEFGQGACQATYLTINHYYDELSSASDAVCTLVRDAKAEKAACGQNTASCFARLEEKNKATVEKLNEMAALLVKERKDLSVLHQQIGEIAKVYKKYFDDFRHALGNAQTPEDIKKALACIDTRSIFGDSDGYFALMNQGWSPSAGTITAADLRASLDRYDSAYGRDFTSPQDKQAMATLSEINRAEEASFPTGAGPLGLNTQEIADARLAGENATRASSELEPKVIQYRDAFAARAGQAGSAADKAGSITGPSGGTHLGKSAAVTSDQAGNLKKLSSAADHAATGRNTSASSSAAPGSWHSRGGTSTAVPAQKLTSRSEGSHATPVTSFARAGTIQNGPQPAWRESAREMLAKAEREKRPESGEERAPHLASETGRGPASVDESASLTAGDAPVPRASSWAAPRERGPVAAARSRNEIAEAMPRANGLLGPAFDGASRAAHVDDYGDSARLRQRLRERLAERQSAGDAAEASSAAEAALSTADAHGDIDTDDSRAGPQSRESEGLFQRIHKAHHRYQLQFRIYPQTAGL